MFVLCLSATLRRVPPEELVKFQVAWDFIKQISAKMGIPLHDVEEIKAKVEAEMRKPNFKEGDITISVLDHATNTMRNLVVEVTKAPKPKHNP